MTMLTGIEILERMALNQIKIEPFDDRHVNPNSVNLTLHPELEMFGPWRQLHMKQDAEGQKITIDPVEGHLLLPGHLYLGRTNEYTETRDLIPILEGRSSSARLGICVHQTGGFGDVGFCGTWTLEITCVVPVRIFPNVAICQISYVEPVGDTSLVYKGKYQGQVDVVRSRLHTELNQPNV